MIIVEIVALKAVMSLAQHLQSNQQTDDEEGKDKDDDKTCLTAALTLPSSATATPRVSLSDHLERQQELQNDDDDELLQSSLWLGDCQSDMDMCSLASTLATNQSLLASMSRAHCSFRPADSICFEDMEDDVLVQLDLSNKDTYDLTKRARRGNEEEDLQVAIQAAIVARDYEQQLKSGSGGSGGGTSPTRRLLLVRQQGSRFLQSRMETLARNTKVVEGFLQDRVGTFARNVETLSMAAKGKCYVKVSYY